MGGSVAVRAWRRLARHPDWNVGVALASPHAFLDSSRSIEVTWFPAQPRHRFIADPFAIERDGTRFVFFEMFDYHQNKGVIQCCALDAENVPGPAETVLSAGHHLSYPFVIEHQGGAFMIPESFEAGEVALHVARDFPRGWSKERALVRDFPGLDCTVFQHEGRWWMAGTRHGGYDLYLWHASDLLGDWTPHALNPVKSDPASSRPGGKPFEFEGALFRPAQNCSERYGGSLVLNRIVKLNPLEFEEETVRECPALLGSYRFGFHTLCGLNGVSLVDGCGEKFVPSEAARVVRGWLSRARQPGSGANR